MREPCRPGAVGWRWLLRSLLVGACTWTGSAVPGADSAAGAPLRPGPARDLTCNDGATVAVPGGHLVNNQWGRASAGRGAWRQCLQSRMGADGRVQFGWRWQWPEQAGLYAYPEILAGRSPWHTAPSNDARFPRRIAATRRLEIAYDLQTDAVGLHNLAADLWITRRAPAAEGPVDVSIIQAELMIWTQASPGLMDPTERPLGEVQAGGQAWLLYAKPGWSDPTGQSKQAWTLISYHAKTPALKARIDALALLKDAIARGLIAADSVVNGVELGNEIVSGRGNTWIREFSVTVE
jgi:Glycosyl hydrolase family 12